MNFLSSLWYLIVIQKQLTKVYDYYELITFSTIQI